MRKTIITVFVGSALCVSTAASAAHVISAQLAAATFDSEEECEEALAQERRDITDREGYQGRDRGQFNKAFNQRYQCEDQGDGRYQVERSN